MIALTVALLLAQDAWRAWGVSERWSPFYVNSEMGLFVDQETLERPEGSGRGWFLLYKGAGQYAIWEARADCRSRSFYQVQAWRGVIGQGELEPLQVAPPAAPIPDTYDEMAYRLLCHEVPSWG